MPNTAANIGKIDGFNSKRFILLACFALVFAAGFGFGWAARFAIHDAHNGASNIVMNVMAMLAIVSQSLFVIYLPLRMWSQEKTVSQAPVQQAGS